MELDALGTQNGCDERSHEVSAVLAHARDITGIQHAIPAGYDDGTFDTLAATGNLLLGGGPVKVLVAMGVLAADHELSAVQEGSSHLVEQGVRTEAGAFGQHIVFQGVGRGLNVHGLAKVSGYGVHRIVYLLNVFVTGSHGHEMLADGCYLIESLLFLHHRLVDGFAEEGFDFLAGTDDGYGGFVAQGGYLGDGTLLEDKGFDNHSIRFCVITKILIFSIFPKISLFL